MKTLFRILPALFFFGCLQSQIRTDLFVETVYKDSLDAAYFMPETQKPVNGYPAILFVHGFSLTKDWDSSNCSVFSKSGYVTACYSVRGHGNSDGGSTIMSVKERSDLAGMLNFLKALPGVDSSKIGLSGGSQGGLHGLWAIADGLPVAAVSSDVIIPHWASDMLMNGSVRRTVLLLLQANLGVRFDPVRDTLWNYLRADDYDSFWGKFIPGRDVDTSLLNRGSAPSLRLLKWQDHYFSASDGIESFSQYGGVKKLYLGTHGHFSDVSGPEKLYQSDLVTRWFDYFLRGQQNGILDEPSYTYAFSQLPADSLGYFSWSHSGVDEFPPRGIVGAKFFLSRDSALLYASPSHADTFAVMNDYLNPAYSFDTAYVEGFQGSRFDYLLPKQAVSFTSPVLWEDMLWCGVPRMKFFVRSDHEKFPLHVQIYEVDSAGRKYFINRINYTARHWTPGTANWVEADGIEHAHKFTRGSRIRIEITNMDKTNRPLLGKHPFVVPVFAQTGASVITDESHRSYIELPMLGDPSGAGVISAERPEIFSLRQNYPNPFNSSTTIGYELARRSSVSLKVYNMLGQELAVLAEGEEGPGFMRVVWRGTSRSGDLPSGVYFCRLKVNEHTIVKKMVLTR